jgi:hypothetical protein
MKTTYRLTTFKIIVISKHHLSNILRIRDAKYLTSYLGEINGSKPYLLTYLLTHSFTHALTHSLTHSLTPYSTVLLEKLTSL